MVYQCAGITGLGFYLERILGDRRRGVHVDMAVCNLNRDFRVG